MSSYTRSEDVSVRKSPSVSATAYQVGTKKIGNDGNLWVIVRDSRGVQRWQKYSGKDNTETLSRVSQNIEPKMTNLKDVYNDLNSKFYGLRLNEETEDNISCDIRNWGNWEHDYEDYERDEEDYEDDDQMILSNDSYKRLKELVNEVSSKYLDVKITYSTGEKNYIDFEITRKPVEKIQEEPKVDKPIEKPIEEKTVDQKVYDEKSGKWISKEDKVEDTSLWGSVKKKFSEVYFEEEDFNNPNIIYSNQVKAEEYVWMFDRYSTYKSSLSWVDAENKFLKMLTPEEKSIIKIEKNLKDIHELFGVMSETKILVKKIDAEGEKFLKGIRASVEGFKILIEDEPELKTTLEEKLKKRIEGLDYLAEIGDEYAGEASKILKAYLKESFKFGGKIKKRQEDEEFYEKALRNSRTKSDREYFLRKLNELDNNKPTF